MALRDAADEVSPLRLEEPPLPQRTSILASDGKTGTTDDETTALFAGHTDRMAAAVWYGDPAAPVGDPVHRFGASVAPVWRQSMIGALT